MSKKSTSARSGVQRNKPKVQKSIELVRPVSTAQETEPLHNSDEPTSIGVATARPIDPSVPAVPSIATLPTVPKAKRRVANTATNTDIASNTRAAAEAALVVPEERVATETPVDVPKGSAAGRLAARRQASQRTQQKNAAMLITPEHYAYVRKDLLFIATLAIIMFAIIIILYFIPGIGL